MNSSGLLSRPTSSCRLINTSRTALLQKTSETSLPDYAHLTCGDRKYGYVRGDRLTDPHLMVAAPSLATIAAKTIRSGLSAPRSQDGSLPKRRPGRPRRRAPLTDSDPEVAVKRGGCDGRRPAVSPTTLDSPQTAQGAWGKFECRRPVPCSLRVKSHNLCSGCINLILEQQKQQHARCLQGDTKTELPSFTPDDWSHEEPVRGPLPDLSDVAASAVAQPIQIGGVRFQRGRTRFSDSGDVPEIASLPKTFQGMLGAYVSVREEIQGWSDFFKSKNGRRPQMSDVVETRIPWLMGKFHEYIRIREKIEGEARLSVRKAALYAGARGKFALAASQDEAAGPSSVKVHSSGWQMTSKSCGGPIRAWDTPGLVSTSVSLDEVDEWMFSLLEDSEESKQQLSSSKVQPVQSFKGRSRVRRENAARQIGHILSSSVASVGQDDRSCPLLDSMEGQAALRSAIGPCEEQWERLGFSTGRETSPSLRARAIAASSAWENLRQESTLPPDLLSELPQSIRRRHSEQGSLHASKAIPLIGVSGSQGTLGVTNDGRASQEQELSDGPGVQDDNGKVGGLASSSEALQFS